MWPPLTATLLLLLANIVWKKRERRQINEETEQKHRLLTRLRAKGQQEDAVRCERAVTPEGRLVHGQLNIKTTTSVSPKFKDYSFSPGLITDFLKSHEVVKITAS